MILIPIRKIIAALLSILAISVLLTCSPSEQQSKKSDELKKLMTFCYENGIFNGTILIAENGETIYKDALGYADFDTKRKLNLDSPFCLASVSKPFTTMAVMILKEQGKLSFDDPLSKYYPEFPAYADNVTIKHLMTHTSGIPYFRLGRNKLVYTNEDVLDLLLQVDTLDFVPGDRYSYSNGAFVLLSMIVEKVSGMPFYLFMKEQIFDPLGMNNTLVYDKSKPQIENRAIGYNGAGGKDDYDQLTTGAAGMYSTVEDLFLWDRALHSGELVSSATMEEAFTPTLLNDGSVSDYGYGWHISVVESGKKVNHSGGQFGFRTYIFRELESENTVIALTNNWEGPPFQSIFAAIDTILMGHPYELPKITKEQDRE